MRSLAEVSQRLALHQLPALDVHVGQLALVEHIVACSELRQLVVSRSGANCAGRAISSACDADVYCAQLLRMLWHTQTEAGRGLARPPQLQGSSNTNPDPPRRILAGGLQLNSPRCSCSGKGQALMLC